MEPLFFVMAIMGCSDDGSACAPARVLPARYETAAQCRAALPQALADNSDVSSPSIAADCRAQGMRLAKVEAKGKRKG